MTRAGDRGPQIADRVAFDLAKAQVAPQRAGDDPGLSAEKLRIALGTAPDLDPASAIFWNWLAPRKAREGIAFTSAMDGARTADLIGA